MIELVFVMCVGRFTLAVSFCGLFSNSAIWQSKLLKVLTPSNKLGYVFVLNCYSRLQNFAFDIFFKTVPVVGTPKILMVGLLATIMR